MAGGIRVRQKGDFKDLKRYLERNTRFEARLLRILQWYGEEGVRTLQAATPKKSGKTALKWEYRIEHDRKGNVTLGFYNEDSGSGVPVIVLLVYGHATRSGGWVQGRDFVTPATDELFQKLQERIRKEVTAL